MKCDSCNHRIKGAVVFEKLNIYCMDCYKRMKGHIIKKEA